MFDEVLELVPKEEELAGPLEDDEQRRTGSWQEHGTRRTGGGTKNHRGRGGLPACR